MIGSLFFVLFVTVVVIISMAIPTLHLERTEAAGSGGRPRTRLSWHQVNISPYRGVWMSSWILFLVLSYTGGRATPPPLDLDIKLFQTHPSEATAAAAGAVSSPGAQRERDAEPEPPTNSAPAESPSPSTSAPSTDNVSTPTPEEAQDREDDTGWRQAPWDRE